MGVIVDNADHQIIEDVTANGRTLSVVFKAGSSGEIQAAILDKAAQALAANATFLTIASPTNAQNAAQLKALTRQVNGLVRVLLNRFDSAGDS